MYCRIAARSCGRMPTFAHSAAPLSRQKRQRIRIRPQKRCMTPQTEDRSDGWGKLELFGMLAALLCTILLLCFEWIAGTGSFCIWDGTNNFSLFEVG